MGLKLLKWLLSREVISVFFKGGKKFRAKTQTWPDLFFRLRVPDSAARCVLIGTDNLSLNVKKIIINY